MGTGRRPLRRHLRSLLLSLPCPRRYGCIRRHQRSARRRDSISRLEPARGITWLRAACRLSSRRHGNLAHRRRPTGSARPCRHASLVPCRWRRLRPLLRRAAHGWVRWRSLVSRAQPIPQHLGLPAWHSLDCHPRALYRPSSRWPLAHPLSRRLGARHHPLRYQRQSLLYRRHPRRPARCRGGSGLALPGLHHPARRLAPP